MTAARPGDDVRLRDSGDGPTDVPDMDRRHRRAA